MLVDDESNILLTLAAVLEREGFSIETASSSKDALHLLQTGTYDVVITDMHMETETAGYEVIQTAKVQPYPPITIILTGYTSQCADWERHGAHALLEKPTDTKELLLTIDTLIREQQHLG